MTAPMPALHVDLATWIGDHVSGLTYQLAAGGNVFVDDLPDQPNRAVALFASGGPEADTEGPYDSPTFQVIVRGDSSATWGLDMALAVYGALHGLRNQALSSGRWLIGCVGVQSGPVRLGPDTSGRYRYSLNFRTEMDNTTAYRP